MKKILLIINILSIVSFFSCVDLDLNPLSEGSSGNWYSSQQEIEMSINDFYRADFFHIDDMIWADDVTARNATSAVQNGTMTAEDLTIAIRWQNYYKGIARALRLLKNMDNARVLGVSEADIAQYEGEAYFYIGYAYGMLAFHWGDAILDKEGITLDEAYKISRSPKADVLAYSYECLDEAAKRLPTSYSGIQRATRGAALAFKARIALWNGDYNTAATAAKACMDLNVYKLHHNYRNLFTASWSDEWIFFFRGDVTLKKYYWAGEDVLNCISRLSGGWGGQKSPSYELVCAYPCIDGKPIDESPLYNPKDLFENRDPRMAMTIVPFATAYNKRILDGTYDPKDYLWLGYEYSPAPNRTTVYRGSDGAQVSNTDSKARAEHASYNGFLFKKYVDESFLENGRNGAPTTYPMLRYGDVLLMYAEAMIELEKCDQGVLDATINKLRERAYSGTGIAYPRVIVDSQNAMRTILRTERFIELAWEGHRYADLIRWKLAEKVYNRPSYFLRRAWSGSTSWNGDASSVSAEYRQLIQNWEDGNYPIGGVPAIDENGIADLSYMVNAGYIVVASERKFEAKRDYLWPVPAADRMINENLDQNPNW
ncbi:MAG: RagB/SusD family nutrient uptake outer membrane protein [Massilibacteroides sp.]|nr:RagB/SusD family nutrient uptake outer membrane protein [Massilibacteroides sp.]MDD3063126.1 RagB/SusD family nutrient uptake outer membrane protein [Massilibacteroides sp.]MDD4114662.1 RagB/SusD family nutrient uptake outer membrane protein [Massilibacteroides sp.]MDD4660820.1 RagB/SusD family nutrient uptake outer membrane protein [Massilibacteroides sp.]